MSDFKKGIIDGIPIALGYFAVSFAFGIFAYDSGLSVLESVLISICNMTSAGQFAAVPIICGSGSYLELALVQLVINIRYSLMSIVIAQKLDNNTNFLSKLLIAYFNTDEIFALGSANRVIAPLYMHGLALMPFFGWTLGTLSGAVLGDILPKMITNCLTMAIYGMFIAIVVPNIKKEKGMFYCVLTGIIFSIILYYCFSNIPSGFQIIIASCLACLIFSILMPIKEDKYE